MHSSLKRLPKLVLGPVEAVLWEWRTEQEFAVIVQQAVNLNQRGYERATWP